MTACFSLPDCFSACKTTQELPVTQLARHVDLFHLMIADNQRPETLSLPYGFAPSIKPTTQFSQAVSLWTWEWQPVLGISNKPFLSTRGVVLIRQYLTVFKVKIILTFFRQNGILSFSFPYLKFTQKDILILSSEWIFPTSEECICYF
jgi:hypothetical protein